MSLHTPVLLEEVIYFLEPRSGGYFIDATLGAGGHSRAILEKTAPEGKLLAIDQDEAALSTVRKDFGSDASRVVFVHSDFRDIGARAAEFGFLNCDGILAD